MSVSRTCWIFANAVLGRCHSHCTGSQQAPASLGAGSKAHFWKLISRATANQFHGMSRRTRFQAKKRIVRLLGRGENQWDTGIAGTMRQFRLACKRQSDRQRLPVVCKDRLLVSGPRGLLKTAGEGRDNRQIETNYIWSMKTNLNML